MYKITIELTTDQMCKLKAYIKAENYNLGEPAYRTFEEMAAFLVVQKTESNQTPFVDDKNSMAVYNREYKRLKSKIRKA